MYPDIIDAHISIYRDYFGVPLKFFLVFRLIQTKFKLKIASELENNAKFTLEN